MSCTTHNFINFLRTWFLLSVKMFYLPLFTVNLTLKWFLKGYLLRSLAPKKDVCVHNEVFLDSLTSSEVYDFDWWSSYCWSSSVAVVGLQHCLDLTCFSSNISETNCSICRYILLFLNQPVCAVVEMFLFFVSNNDLRCFQELSFVQC